MYLWKGPRRPRHATVEPNNGPIQAEMERNPRFLLKELEVPALRDFRAQTYDR